MKEKEKNISIRQFYINNKQVIGMKQNEFFGWITENFYANYISDKKKYIATSLSVDSGYMVNKRKIVLDVDDFNVVITYNAYITPKGQEHLLKIFEENKKVEGE